MNTEYKNIHNFQPIPCCMLEMTQNRDRKETLEFAISRWSMLFLGFFYETKTAVNQMQTECSSLCVCDYIQFLCFHCSHTVGQASDFNSQRFQKEIYG